MPDGVSHKEVHRQLLNSHHTVIPSRPVIRILPALLVLSVALSLDLHAQAAPEPVLSIIYRCRAADRPTVLEALDREGVGRIAEWKRKGWVKDGLFLANNYTDTNSWDVMLVLHFATGAERSAWAERVKGSGGPVPASVAAQLREIRSVRAFVYHHSGRQGDLRKAIYVAIPYRRLVSREQYQDYISVYGVPQFDGWIAEKACSSYDILINEEEVDSTRSTQWAWDALLLFDYNGVEGLGRRDEVKAGTRVKLREQSAVWSTVSDTKSNYRTEWEVVMSTPAVQNR